MGKLAAKALAILPPKWRPVIEKQFNDLRSGRVLVVRRKLSDFILMLLALVPVLLARLLSPMVKIRFGGLQSERIGHFAANTELYLCERDAGMHGKRALDIFYHYTPICNEQLKKMWDRTLHVSSAAKWLARTNQWLPGGRGNVIPMPTNGDRDIHGYLDRTPPHLAFTVEEEREGQAGLRCLGIPEGTEFVCFHSRDSLYLNSTLAGTDWTGHDFRDTTSQNYVPMAAALGKRGYYTVRMGAYVQEKLESDNSKILDYAANGSRTDFLDIYLSARCRFFICNTSGIYAVPLIFRKPLVYVNYLPLEWAVTWNKNDLFIPKKLWLRKDSRYLTFRETFESGAGTFNDTHDYVQAGIDIIENTPEEITAAAIEMNERLNGTWQTDDDAEELQKRFWSIFKTSDLHGTIVSRIGTNFLKQNREMLEI